MNTYGVVNQKQNQNGSNLYKWLILISFSLNSFSNIFSYGVILIVGPYVADYFNTTPDVMDWLNNISLYTAILFSFLINPFIIRNFGVSQIASSLMTAVSLWIIALAHSSYLGALIGLILMGLGQCSFYQVPLYLSKLWFEPQERIMSTFIGQYMNAFGQLIGYCVSAYYFYDIFDQQEINQKFYNLMLFNAIVAVIATVANFVALKQNDKMNEKLELRENIKDSLFKVFARSENVLDLFSVAVIVGYSWNYTLLFNTLQYQIGQSYQDQIIVSILYQVGTIVAAYICTLQLTKQSQKGLQPQYDKFIKYSLGMGFFFLSIVIVVYDSLPPILLAILNFFIGAGTGGLYSLFLESLMEKHYPIQELTIGTILFIVASVEGLIMNSILRISELQNYGFMISCFFTVAPFCYIMGFYETQYKRFEQEG